MEPQKSQINASKNKSVLVSKKRKTQEKEDKQLAAAANAFSLRAPMRKHSVIDKKRISPLVMDQYVPQGGQPLFRPDGVQLPHDPSTEFVGQAVRSSKSDGGGQKAKFWLMTAGGQFCHLKETWNQTLYKLPKHKWVPPPETPLPPHVLVIPAEAQPEPEQPKLFKITKKRDRAPSAEDEEDESWMASALFPDGLPAAEDEADKSL